jgi:glutamate N-acetyltransferase/amino-acid N-acetyltransferase
LPVSDSVLAEAGIRKANRRDLTLIALDAGVTVAGVFTQNRFCAAPVQLCRRHLSAVTKSARWSSTPASPTPVPASRASRLQATCAAVAQMLGGIQNTQVLPFSTGVILEPLPVERLVAGLPAVPPI